MSTEAARLIYNEMKNAGLTLRQAVTFTDELRAAKTASVFGEMMGGIKGLADASGPFVHVGLLAPPALGYLAGDLTARAMDADNSNVADIQEQELVAELAVQAESLRRRQKLRQLTGKV